MLKIRCDVLALAALLSSACASTTRETVAVVRALAETPPIGLTGDAADDPAIWVAPQPGNSRVIGTQKKGGYYIYDLDGRMVQEVLLGLPNNVDLAPDFAWAEGRAPVVVASDRADNTVPVFRLDPATGRLEPQPRARIATGFGEVYGVCVGRRGDDMMVAATSKIGEVVVWKLEMRGPEVVATRTGGFVLGSITEGCAIDGPANTLFVAQELRALWRVGLDDADGAGRSEVDAIASGGRLKADLEGVAVWEGPNGGGYVVLSVQGRSVFAVYDRTAPHAYRGSFRIADGDGADRVTGTDGIAVTSAPLGTRYTRGLFVAQDDENTRPRATQNFKYVSWLDIEVALGLQ